MREIMQICEQLNLVTDVPFSLLDGEGRLLRTWPSFDLEALLPGQVAHPCGNGVGVAVRQLEQLPL